MSDQALETLERLIDEAEKCHAWKVILAPDEPPIFRVKGKIERREGDALTTKEVADIAIAAVGTEQIAQLGRESSIADCRVELPGAKTAVVSVARVRGQLTVIAAVTRPFNIDLKRLRVPEAIVKAAEAPSGLVIVTGPAGCGKTTTAYALLDHINATRDAHIVTAEYGVECVLESKRGLVQQRQIGVDTPDMMTGIVSAICLDADVLFVGEIRDLEVFQRCLIAAESMGQLVITQLHQPTPESAIQRMIDLQVPQSRQSVRKMIAKVLRGVIAQRLLPTKKKAGVVAAYDVLIPDEQVRKAILEGIDLTEQTFQRPEGCLRLADDMARLRDEGVVSTEVADQALKIL